jgi:hypothetical protein
VSPVVKSMKASARGGRVDGQVAQAVEQVVASRKVSA